jgi:cellulose synthase/poly-beta-1,6-N-acetylglucosamine synthase-like glycosyltransferase
VSAAPPVSVLLPVRDAAEHLDEAARSLEAQTFADFEVVVVDDGSRDATADILADWRVRDRRVRVLRQSPSGIVSALERARTEARGVYLARMDGDDVSEPGRLAAQHALMEAEPATALCGCGVTYFPISSVRSGGLRYERWMNGCRTPDDIARDVFVECPVAHPTFFMRADTVARVGGYRDAGWPEDYDLVLRLWSGGERLAKVPASLLRWRESPSRLSRTDGRYSPEAFLACKVHHLRETLLSDGRRAVVWGAGPVGKSAARALRATGTEVVAFVEVNPRQLGQRIHGTPVTGIDDALRIDGALHLAAVGRAGARERLRGLLAGAGLRELRDFVAIA